MHTHTHDRTKSYSTTMITHHGKTIYRLLNLYRHVRFSKTNIDTCGIPSYIHGKHKSKPTEPPCMLCNKLG